MMLEFKTVQVQVPKDCNVIIGMSHFIKTIEDLYEALTDSVPTIKFGIGFCESSGPCLVRHEGNDDELRQLAAKKALEIGCGHSFIIFLKDAYPLNVLTRIKQVPEVCTIYAATANPLEIVVSETDQGRGIVSVVDGFKSEGIEADDDIQARKNFLRKIGYKLD
jgi:adenosine/AMP kinase